MTLTHKQILEMTPEQLRKNIAVQIGYHEDEDDDDLSWILLDKAGHLLDICSVYDLPDYSHDIAVAWKLVEGMNDHCWTVNIQREANGATVFVTERGAVTHEAKKIWEFGETAPIAICRAWLMWKKEVKK